MKVVYELEKDYVDVRLIDDDGNARIKSQLPKEEVVYAAARITRELGLPVDEAFDIAVYAVFLKVTWGL